MSDFEFDPERHVAVTKEQAAVFQRGMNVLNKLWSDPKDGLEFKRKVKKVEPSWAIPEVDIVDQAKGPIDAALGDFSKKLDAVVDRLDGREKAEKEKGEERSLQDALTAARREYQLTDDGMDKVIARMKETGNPDPASAAAWVTDHMPKASPTAASGFGPRALNLFGSQSQDDNWADLHKDPDGWFDREVDTILREFNQAA